VSAVNLRIEEIVLHGLSVEDVPAFKAALRERLAELAQRHEAPMPHTTVAVRRGTPVAAGPADQLAARVAGSVWTAATATQGRPAAEGQPG
jgi:hypothetical protein